MANTNTLTAVLDRILAGTLPVLRQNCVMPRLVNSSYSSIAGSKGSTMEISVPAAASAGDVTPSNTAPDIAGVEPSIVTVSLNKWKESGFFMSDKDVKDVRDGIVNGQMESCVKAIAEQVNSDLLDLYKEVYGYAGTAGTTPFATGLDEVAAARRVLAGQLCPLMDRRGVIDLDAEANFSLLGPVLKANERGDQQGITEGRIGRILGIDWFPDQQVKTHTQAAATGGTIALDDSASRPIGTKTLHMDGFSTKPEAGDVFTIAGDSQTYTVVSSTTLAGTDSDVTFEPGLKVAIPAVDGSEVVTFKGNHDANLVFNRFAFAFVNRPFDGGMLAGRSAGNFSVMQDPVSGLSIRVELTREHRRDKLSFDMLYGVKCVRPEYATRIAG